MALYFSGSTGNYAEITNGYASTLSGTSGMITFWLKPIYNLGIAISTKSRGSGALFVETKNAAGSMYVGVNGFQLITNAAFASDTWVFVAVGGNGTTSIAAGISYVNAELVFQHLSSVVWIATAANLYLGRWDSGTFPYKGWIGDIRVWNRRLTPAEVLAVYQNQNVTSGLVERWPLTESSGSTITGTIAGLNGTITGTPTWGGPAIPYGTPSGSSRPSSPFLPQVIG
jgi:hypothetical protein